MDQLRKLYQSLSVKQRWSILAIVAVLGAGLFSFSRWQHERDFRPLFSSLTPEDAASMVQKLKEKGVEYRISENGAAVLAPEARLAELRLEMAGLGLPKTGRIGFEIFDKTNFAITDFAEKVNFRRAVEGELERSVMALAEVEQARVHVTFPKESVFLDAREPAKASVLVRLRPGAHMSPQNVSAVTHLAASAVEGLSPEAVSVVDMRGNMLNRVRKPSADGSDESSSTLEYQQQIEKELTSKINSTLEPLLGENRFRTGVFVECDMTAGEQSEETFDPSKSVMTSSQRTEDTPGAANAGGVPGTASNLSRPPARVSGTLSGPSRKVENITYQSSRTVRHTKLRQGSIKHLSVAVLIDQEIKWEGQGAKLHRVVVPPAPEKLKTIHELVAALVGFDEDRGDQLTVETLPFDSTLNSDPPLQLPAPAAPKQTVDPKNLPLNRPAMIGIGVATLAILTGLLYLRSRTRKRMRQVDIMKTVAPGTEDIAADIISLSNATNDGLAQGSEMASLPPSKAELLLIELRESATREPDTLATVLKEWILAPDEVLAKN